MNLRVQQARQAERVLGAVLVGVRRPLEECQPEDFQVERHRRAFKALLQADAQGRPIALESLPVGMDLGEAIKWANLVGLGTHVGASIRDLREVNARLAATERARDLIALAQDGSYDQLREGAEHLAGVLCPEPSGRMANSPINTTLARWEDRFSALRRGEAAPVIRHGLWGLRAFVPGWTPGGLNVVAAGPSIGKSMIMVQILLAATDRAADHLGRVPASVLFALEMPDLQIADRMIAHIAGVDLARLSRGEVTDVENRLILDARDRLRDRPIVLIDSPRRLDRLVSEVRRLHRHEKCDLVLIDYVGLIRPDAVGRSRTEEIGLMTKTLKGVALELDIPVILAAQLNRSGRERAAGHDTPAQLHDLAESAALEQDADVVLVLHRPEERRRVETLDDFVEDDIPDGPVPFQIAVRKNRNGPAGVAMFRADYSQQRVLDMEPGP